MSTATTNTQALAEFVADLKRLNPKRQDFLAAVDSSVVQLQENANGMRKQVAEAVNAYLVKETAAVEAHVEAEMSAKEALRGAFDVKATAIELERAKSTAPTK